MTLQHLNINMLDRFIEEYNRMSYPKNFPFLLKRSNFGVTDLDGNNEKYGIKLIVAVYHPYKDEDGLRAISESSFIPVFEIEDSILVDDTNYADRLEESIIKQFKKINFKDTLISFIK